MKKEIVGWFKLGVYLVMAVFLSRLVFLTLVLGEYHENQASGNRIRKERVEPVRGVVLDRYGEYLVVNKKVDGKVVRHYPLGEITAGITGFVGEISEDRLKLCGESCFLGQMVGKSGLEAGYEDKLKGSWGLKLIEENALGEKMKELDRENPTDGEDLRLNLDIGLQRQVYWAMREMIDEHELTGGGAVVSKVNGEVLALVSLPGFDPNLFIKDGVRGEEGGAYSSAVGIVGDNEGKPMFNRVISGVYPPGSVFKLVVATAGLEEEVVDKNKTVEDKGEIKIGEFRFGNWYFDKYGRTEGEVNIEKALARSNDIYFYKLGEWLGVDNLVKWSGKMGIGRQTEIDLPGEASGFLPTPLWREKRTGERWFLGNTYHLAIGQGDLLVTPLQVNVWTASVFSGKVCRPRLVSGDSDCEGIDIGETTKSLIASGMKQACMSGGTAFSFFDMEGKVYCKTGTAQHGGEDTEPHAWITVVVPMPKALHLDGQAVGDDENDWVVVTVMLEESGEGSEMAGPVAKEIVDYLLQGASL
jgi:penicillin-binding protein 2